MPTLCPCTNQLSCLLYTSIIKNDARRFLARLLESNSTRVQSDILNRVQDSRAKLETEIRKLLHEVSRIAEQALVRARKVKEDGDPAVQAELDRLDGLEHEVTALRESTPVSYTHLDVYKRQQQDRARKSAFT